MTYRIALALLLLALLATASCGGGGTPQPVGPTASELATEGETALLAGDGTTAKEKFEASVAKDASQRTANFGLGLVRLLKVANDVVKGLAVANQAPFKNISQIGLGALPVPSIGGQPLAGPFRQGSLIDTDFGTVDFGNQTGAQLHTLLLTATTGLDGSIAAMKAALTGADDTFTFQVPRDWNNGASGTITLSRADMLALLGGLELAAGQLHFAAAFDSSQFSRVNDEWVGMGNAVDPVDSDSNGFFDFGELATSAGIPAGAGVKLADGNTHLASFVNEMHDAAGHLVAAGDTYAAGNQLENHWGFDLDADEISNFKTKWPAKYRDGLLIFSEAFSTGTTLTKARLDNLDNDPGSSTVPAGFTQQVNLKSFFTNLPADLRNVPLREVEDGFGEINLPEQVGDALTDATLLGLFPGGLSQANYAFFKDTFSS